jgi:hypothetical protein
MKVADNRNQVEHSSFYYLEYYQQSESWFLIIIKCPYSFAKKNPITIGILILKICVVFYHK